MKAATETALVAAILQFLKLRRIMAWRVHTQGTYDPVRKVRRTFHGRKGVADIAGVLCHRDDDGRAIGRALFIEVKLPGGKLSEEQRQFIDEANANGAVAFVARSLADVELFLSQV